MVNEFMKHFKRAIGRNLLLFAMWVIQKFPYSFVKSMTRVLTFIGPRFLVKHQKIARENLQFAFGREKSEAQINQLANECFVNFGKGMVDLAYYIDTPSKLASKVTVEGKKYLDEALKLQKGVIAVSAHFGNFVLMHMKLILDGYKVNVMIRPTRDQKFEKYIYGLRIKVGIKTIYAVPRRACIQQCLNALRNNEIVFILLDQNFGDEGNVFVDFFGKQAATAPGPVVLAKRTGAPIVPMFIRSNSQEEHRVMIDPPLILEDRMDKNEELTVNLERITKIIERYIRLYPVEWSGWVHKRWKSRPKMSEVMI